MRSNALGPWCAVLLLSAAISVPPAAAMPVAADVPATAPPYPGEDRARAADCLTAAVAYEAGFEPLEGQQAVAEVVLNRVRHPAYPKTVCGVVFAGSTRRTGCQFTFTCDGALARRLPDTVMLASRRVAEAALDGLAPSRVAMATHYHADYVRPYWASSLVRVANIGAHVFYRMPGAGELRGGAMAFAAAEPDVPALAAVTASRSRRRPAPVVAPSPVFAPWGLRPGR